VHETPTVDLNRFLAKTDDLPRQAQDRQLRTPINSVFVGLHE
jgi:hypothetical protein